MININTNLSSLISQRNLNKSTEALNKSIERMTTGYKLNRASDNAANFSISTAITTKLNSYFVAKDNVMNGMDLVNAASSSIDLIATHIERIRELSIQAANDTYDKNSLKAINVEVNARVDEIERIYASSEYNGIKFGGEETEAKFLENISRRNASDYKSFSSVKIDEALTSGTYSIKTAEELAKLATMTNNGLISTGVEFVLGANIDLKDYDNWTPIGNATNAFNGKFDGNGYVISNLSINTSGTKIGLFGLTANAEIKNVALKSVNIILNGATINDRHIGGLVGYLGNNSTLINSYVTGQINACANAKIVGGLVGQVYNNSVVDSCYSECDVINVNSMGSSLLGSLEQNSTLKNSYSNGLSSGKSYMGGLIGAALNNAKIEDSYCTGDVKGNQSGGIAGSMHTNSSIINSWTSSEVKAINGTSTAGVIYTAAGILLEGVYVLEENNKHSGIFVATYRSTSSGNIEIRDCYYSNYYDDYSVPISSASQTIVSNVNLYEGDTPFLYKNQSNIYTLYQNVKLQVGIYADDNSAIEVNTGYLLSGIKQLRNIGQKQGDYLTHCDSLLKKLEISNVEFGAVQNRLESALGEISTKCNNLISTNSTIRDVDVTKESSEYIKYQILQQATATLLSTVNQTPAIALQLI